MAWYDGWECEFSPQTGNHWWGAGIAKAVQFHPILDPTNRHPYSPLRYDDKRIWDWHPSVDASVAELNNDLSTDGGPGRTVSYGWDGQYMWIVTDDGGTNVYLERVDPRAGIATVMETIAFGADRGTAVYDPWNDVVWWAYTDLFTGPNVYLRKWDIGAGTGSAIWNTAGQGVENIAIVKGYVYLHYYDSTPEDNVLKWDISGASASTQNMSALNARQIGAAGWRAIENYVGKVDEYGNEWDLGIEASITQTQTLLYDVSASPYKIFVLSRDTITGDTHFYAYELEDTGWTADQKLDQDLGSFSYIGPDGLQGPISMFANVGGKTGPHVDKYNHGFRTVVVGFGNRSLIVRRASQIL